MPNDLALFVLVWSQATPALVRLLCWTMMLLVCGILCGFLAGLYAGPLVWGVIFVIEELMWEFVLWFAGRMTVRATYFMPAPKYGLLRF